VADTVVVKMGILEHIKNIKKEFENRDRGRYVFTIL